MAVEDSIEVFFTSFGSRHRLFHGCLVFESSVLLSFLLFFLFGSYGMDDEVDQ